jgi:NAD+ synthase (glutamine-hydrolysing)
LGDFKKNQIKIETAIAKAANEEADLIILPEAVLFGYPPFDLLERGLAVENQLQCLTDLSQKLPKNITAFVGCFSRNQKSRGRPFYNSVAVLKIGKPIRFFHKTLLPTGDVFDEHRFCESGDISKNLIKIKGYSVLVSICEDIWAWSKNSVHSQNPLLQLDNKKIDLIVNISASPFFVGKLKSRHEVVQKAVQFFSVPVIYVNAVGAQDELIFDGRSFLMNSEGQVKNQLKAFEEDLEILAVEKLEVKKTKKKLFHEPFEDDVVLLRSALVLGIKDYCTKIGLTKLHLGLSGGIDSALVACIAAEAIGAENVTTIALPGPFNAVQSFALAKQLSEQLGTTFMTWDIHPYFENFKKDIQKYLHIDEFGLVHENLQARLRGLILMIISNAQASMLLSTSNKSEIATGYSTLYGDMCGGLAPIGDLTKAQVYQLSRWYYENKNWIPIDIIERAPSAELRPNQRDQDSLPPYPKLDVAVTNIIEKCEPTNSKIEEWLLGPLFRNEFKRWQSPPILKVSAHAFGRGRRYPIAHKFRG